jgi:hypothetical protein
MEIMAGGKLAHAFDNRGVVRDVTVGEEILDPLRARQAAQQGMGEQPLELRGEDQGAVGQLGVEERLHTEPVASEEQRVRHAVVNGEGEHAVELVEAIGAPAGPALEDDLGVAFGAEPMTPRLQLGAHLTVIVDLAVVADRETALFVEHRLRGGVREIDD